jgi:multidrug efflux pump subunit AcrB
MKLIKSILLIRFGPDQIHFFIIKRTFVLMRIPTDIFPQIHIPVVAELWEYKGLTAKEMSERVASQAESELGQAVDNIEHTEFFCGIGKVFFQLGTDINTQITMSGIGSSGQFIRGIQHHSN